MRGPDAIGYKLGSVLLQYPTVALFDGVGQLATAARGTSRRSQKPFCRFIEWLGRTSPETVARHYVDTFDLPTAGAREGASSRRPFAGGTGGRPPGLATARGGGGSTPRRGRCALYLSYHRYGDTRKRGMAMLTFTAAYRAAGFELTGGELPDYLPLVLDFAALHPRGERLLRSHRADLELLLRGLRDVSSPYADVVEGVCAELPALRRPDEALVRRLWEAGPPGEDVGLEPFAPPEFLTGYTPTGEHSLEASR